MAIRCLKMKNRGIQIEVGRFSIFFLEGEMKICDFCIFNVKLLIEHQMGFCFKKIKIFLKMCIYFLIFRKKKICELCLLKIR